MSANGTVYDRHVDSSVHPENYAELTALYLCFNWVTTRLVGT